jgi:hypothetical protein
MQQFRIEILEEQDIDALLALQSDNLKKNLDEQTIDSQGFVSFVYTPDVIKGMMASEPQIIAKQGDTIIGYALTTSLDFGKTIPLMQPLIEKSRELYHQIRPLSMLKYYVMGQVCVRHGYRGIGVFDALYQGHKQYLSPRYDCVITEIATENKRSLAAHRRVGFTTINEYFDNISQKTWEVVLWDWQ